MVIGMEAFREAFKGYEDCYTIIGGTACDILMNKAIFHMSMRKKYRRYMTIVKLNFQMNIMIH